MKIKKVLSLVLVFMLLLSTTSAFAAVPEGTIVFGNVAYDLQALADDSFTSEILGNYRDNNNDFAYKKIGGDWVNSLNNETTPELPATITLKKGDGTTEIITVEEPTGELKVVGVSAIDEYGVTVAFENAPEEDLDDVTIEVLDNKGNIVAVKPVTVAAEETEVTFDFEKTQEKQEGVWTIGGVEYDFDLIANLAKFKENLTQVQLKKVLEDLGIENVKIENIPTYNGVKKDNFLDNLEGDLTVEAIQNWVNKINNETLTEKEEDAIVKEVEEVKGNDILLLPVLEKYFERVNSDWIADYNMSTVIEGTTTVKQIQTIINNANNVKLKNEDAVKLMFVKKDLLEAKELIEKYATPELDKDNKEVQSEITKKALKAIEVQLAVVDVREATTPTRLKSALTKLDEVVAKDDKFMAKDGDYKGYVDANAKLYFEVDANNSEVADFKEVKSAKDVRDIINAVNAKVDNAAQAINDRIDVNGLYNMQGWKATNNDGTITENTTGYAVDLYFAKKTDKGAIVKSITAEFYDKDDVLLLTEKSTSDYIKEVNEKLTVDNKGRAVISIPVDVFGQTGIGKDNVNTMTNTAKWTHSPFVIIEEVKVKVEYTDGKTAEGDAKLLEKGDNPSIHGREALMKSLSLRSVNDAETAEEVRDALLAKGITEYINVPKADRLFVAEKVLDARNEVVDTKKFADYSGLTTALGEATTARTNALNGVNNLTADKLIAEVIEALEAVSAEFAEMTNAEKAEIAETFFLGLFNEKGEVVTGFRTLAAVKTAAGL